MTIIPFDWNNVDNMTDLSDYEPELESASAKKTRLYYAAIRAESSSSGFEGFSPDEEEVVAKFVVFLNVPTVNNVCTC